MINISPSLINAIDEFSKLPSIGKKTAQRLVFHLLKQPERYAKDLSSAIIDVKTKIKNCKICHNYCEGDICSICSNPSRDISKICVLEQASDIYPIEKAGTYRGLYHVLGGALPTLDGITQDDIRIKELTARITEDVKEVIIATNANSAGETTALYITKILSNKNIKVTRLSRGIPMGGELEYADTVTIHRAFEDRISL